MSFLDNIIDWFANIGGLIADGFGKLFEFLAKPFSFLLSLLEGIFYFFTVLFDIAVNVVMIFVALFQFVIAIITGLLRTLMEFLTPSINASNVNMPSNSSQGLGVVIDVIDPTGLLNIVPYIAIALVWMAFIFKILALFGGNIVAKGGN